MDGRTEWLFFMELGLELELELGLVFGLRRRHGCCILDRSLVQQCSGLGFVWAISTLLGYITSYIQFESKEECGQQVQPVNEWTCHGSPLT